MSHLGSKDFRNILEVRQEMNDRIQKGLYGGLPEEDLIQKSSTGEGSKGGKVIGHTRTGKPIYQNAASKHHKDFTAEDHQDAIDLKKKEFQSGKEKPTLDKINESADIAGHIHAKAKLSKSTERTPAGKQKDLWLEGKHDEAYQIHKEGVKDSTHTKESYSKLMNRMLDPKNNDPFDLSKFKKSESTDLEKAFETIGLDIEKGGEGSRGGKVVGHTKSGKPIYEDHTHSSHKKFDHNDHEDAALTHSQLSNNAGNLDDMYNHAGASIHHWEEHYKKGGKYKDSVIGKTKSGKDIFNRFDHSLHSDFKNPDDHVDAANAHTSAREKRKEEIVKDHGHDKKKVVEKMSSDRTIQSHDEERQKHLDHYGKAIEKENKYKQSTLEKINNASEKELEDIHHVVNHSSVGWSSKAKEDLNFAIENKRKNK